MRPVLARIHGAVGADCRSVAGAGTGARASTTRCISRSISLPSGHPKLAEFAQRLRTGYLNIFGPQEIGSLFPQLCFMLDVEDGRPKWNNVGDQSAGANDFIARGQEYFQNPQAASGYLNFNANGDLWQTIPPGLKMIVPRYSGPDVPPVAPITPFGHQYADDEDTPPFGPSDINQSKMTLTQWLAAWGTNRG